MTNQKRITLQQLKIKTLVSYCNFCEKLDQTPKMYVVSLISKTDNIEALKITISEFESNN